MWKRLLPIAALASLLIVAGAPAALMDRLLARLSDGRLRVLETSGSLWNGKGVFASLAADGRNAQPWLSATWAAEFDVGSLELGWRLEEAQQVVLRFTLGPAGVAISRAAFDAPLKALLDSLPYPVARAGWRGVLRIESEGVLCNRGQSCIGSARLIWRDAGVDLLPAQRFGDYEILAEAKGREGTFVVHTLGGELRLEGEGGWSLDDRPHFSGEVSGPEAIVSRLPNVMDGYAFPTGDPDRVTLEFD